MKFWFVCLVVIFGMTELYEWLQGLTLPVPVYGVAGLGLALLSNSNQWLPRLRQAHLSSALSAADAAPTWVEVSPEAELPARESQSEEIQMLPVHSSDSTHSEPQLPNLPPQSPAVPPISFTIRKP